MIITDELREIRKMTPKEKVVRLLFYSDGNYTLDFIKDERKIK